LNGNSPETISRNSCEDYPSTQDPLPSQPETHDNNTSPNFRIRPLRSPTVIPSMPGLPLLLLTRLRANRRFERSTTRSISVPLPERSLDVCRHRYFLTPLVSRGFTSAFKREFQLPGHLRQCTFEAHRSFLLIFLFGPSSRFDRGTTMASADFLLHDVCRVALSGVRQDIPR
jgi:hypothetical protein